MMGELGQILSIACSWTALFARASWRARAWNLPDCAYVFPTARGDGWELGGRRGLLGCLMLAGCHVPPAPVALHPRVLFRSLVQGHPMFGLPARGSRLTWVCPDVRAHARFLDPTRLSRPTPGCCLRFRHVAEPTSFWPIKVGIRNVLVF